MFWLPPGAGPGADKRLPALLSSPQGTHPLQGWFYPLQAWVLASQTSVKPADTPLLPPGLCCPVPVLLALPEPPVPLAAPSIGWLWEPGCCSDINAFPLPFPRSESSLSRFAHRLSVKQKQEKRRKAEYASAELSAFRPRSLSIEW